MTGESASAVDIWPRWTSNEQPSAVAGRIALEVKREHFSKRRTKDKFGGSAAITGQDAGVA